MNWLQNLRKKKRVKLKTNSNSSDDIDEIENSDSFEVLVENKHFS